MQGATATFAPSTVHAQDKAGELVKQLRSSKDFRLRMQAALELGKQRVLSARSPLERALSDDSAAVRAAAAAALKSLGDKRALPALRRASTDRSEAVRNQVASAIDALDGLVDAAFLVDLGDVENDGSAREKGLLEHLRKVTRRRLSRVPGVEFKGGQKNAKALPELLLDAKLSRVRVKRSSSALAVSAKVDFVVSRMPGREIKGRLTGNATVHGDPKTDRSARDLRQLRLEAIEAATDSALQNASRALRAAAD